MKNFIAILVKDEKQPKFFLVEDDISEESFAELLDKFNIKKDLIQSIHDMGTRILDPLFLANLENKDGILSLVENYAKSVLDVRIRKNRNTLLEFTDKQFMEALSRGDKKITKIITENKQYLRDVTKNKLQDDNGKFYNFFFNISDLNIIDGGKGYDSPPKINISLPTCENMDALSKMNLGTVGKQAQATCSIKNGSVYEITMENWGSGYVDLPTITVGPPTSKNSKPAILAPVIINTLILERKK